MMSPIGIIDAGYNMDSGYVYAKFITGDIVLIGCDEVEKTYADNMYKRSELDCLIWNDPGPDQPPADRWIKKVLNFNFV